MSGTATFLSWLTQLADEGCQLQGTATGFVILPDGSPAYRSNPVGTAVGAAKLGNLGNLGVQFGAPNLAMQVSYNRIYFTYQIKPSSGDEMLWLIADISSNEKHHLMLRSDGRLQSRSVGTIVAPVMGVGSTVLQPGVKYRLEIQTGTGNPAFWEVLLAVGDEPASIEMNGMGNLGTNPAFQQVIGKEVNANSNTVDFYFQDLFWTDQGYVGPGHCVALLPSIDGNYIHGTPNGASNLWQCLADLPPDEDATFVNGLVNGQVYTARTAGGLRGSINSVKSYARARSNDGITNIMWNTRLRSGSVDVDTLNNGLSDLTYLSRQKIFDTDPATGKPWTNASVNAAQVGFIQNTAAPMRATSACVMVDYLAAPPAQLVDGLYFWKLRNFTPPNGIVDFGNVHAAYHPGVTLPRTAMAIDTAGLVPPFKLGYFNNLGSQPVQVLDDGMGAILATLQAGQGILLGTGGSIKPLGQNVPALLGMGLVEYLVA